MTSERSFIDPRGPSPLPSLFSVKGERAYPESIDLSTMYPIVDMTMQGYKDLHDYTRWRGAAQIPGGGIGGQQTQTYRILSYGQAFGADPQIVVPVNHCFVIWQISMMTVFDAAGAAAFAGKHWATEITLNCPTVFTNPAHHIKPYRADFTGTASARNIFDGYDPGTLFTKENLRIVPAGCFLNLITFTQAGAPDLFPVNTIFEYVIQGHIVPVGEPIPKL